jgi:hypothetical protein
MRTLYLIPFLFALACAVQQEIQPSKTDIENMTASAEIYVNNMPTMGDPPSPYAVITLTADGDTLQNNWDLSRFTLLNTEGEILQQLSHETITVEYTRKLKTRQAIIIRELTSPLPPEISIRINIINENGRVHELEIEHVYPIYLE